MGGQWESSEGTDRGVKVEDLPFFFRKLLLSVASQPQFGTSAAE